jgi:hypothetical protein
MALKRPVLIVPTLCVGMQPLTLRGMTVPGVASAVRQERGASREAFHAERGNEQSGVAAVLALEEESVTAVSKGICSF